MERLATTALRTIHQQVSKALHEPTALYLIGSHARGNADQASDVDIVIITRGDAGAAHRIATSAYARHCPDGPQLDLTVLAHDELGHSATTDLARVQRREVLFPLVDHGQHIAGPDLATRLASRLTVGAAPTTHMPWVFARRTRGLPERLQSTPVSVPPNPDDEFLGYPSGSRTKVVVSLASWIGAGIIAMRTGWEHLATKEHVVARLNDIDVSGARWLSETITVCRSSWGYSVPQSTIDRALLRKICQRLHQMERDYATRHQSWQLESAKGRIDAA
ncbi:nucleotidyltransferase domain-containing protein [Micromonospora craniellae]|uniref:Nucleotidyltransferase domain-containing protein n=1 Tax=Micromonospora craniellae TaxID=2294034 RepID=A0A372FRN6_9ACTN|nr:nucleotidyltransferase domain-containing protein [Micromonospora craniellae]QOC93914.1 nucleotidyltransferase domain-containing protein [Micromonospora craniellae]RFS43401.1 nucleotidyltransferase domain-containing protein [Micromonospora craniellae]